MLIYTKNPMNMKLPNGYTILGEDRYAKNLAPENVDYYIFFAIARTRVIFD
jgi:hypothetical protein